MIRRDTAFDNSRFSRVHTIRPVETYQASFASPEDVIIKKMEYYRYGTLSNNDCVILLELFGESLFVRLLSRTHTKRGRRVDLAEFSEVRSAAVFKIPQNLKLDWKAIRVCRLFDFAH